MALVTITATAYRIDPDRDRIAIVIRKNAGDPVYYGFQDTVTGPAATATCGVPISDNEVLIFERDGGGVNHAAGPVYLVCAAGETATVFIQEQV